MIIIEKKKISKKNFFSTDYEDLQWSNKRKFSSPLLINKRPRQLNYKAYGPKNDFFHNWFYEGEVGQVNQMERRSINFL